MTDFLNTSTSNEQRVAASELRLRALVTATSDVIYCLSPDWRVMQELDGRGFLKDSHGPTVDWKMNNVHPADMEKVMAAIDEAIKNKKIFELEHRVLRADGTPGWTFSRAVPILDEQGEIVEWFGTASDITERKTAEEALKDSRAKSDQQKRLYETITSNTPDLMYVFDLNCRLTYANRALLNTWGKTWETAIGKSLLENGYEQWHAEMHEREMDQIKTSKQPVRGEVSFPHAVLGRRVYDYILIPVLNEHGEVEAIAGTTRDITERKEWEDSLARNAEEQHLAAAEIKRAKENLGMAIDAAGLATFYINATDRILVASSKLKELFGYLPDDEVSLDATIRQTHQDFREEVVKGLESTFTNGARFDMEYPIVGQNDGKIRWVRVIGEIQHKEGVEYFAGVLHEITERKQDEIRKNDFIGMVSHELKTPLTSMKGYIQLLLTRINNQDSFNRMALEKTNIQVTKMTGMINGFLNISRLESGKINIDYQIFDLALLLKEAEDETTATITSHHVIFEPVETTFVNADRDKIGQVIQNLISNAVKYAAPNTTINIACITTDNLVKISVKDHGMGIQQDELIKIFDRYYRVEGGHMSLTAGFGIGLYLCSEIIQRHKGKIWAESTYGSGATFTFSLPLATG
jgi:two-component system sensor histidine kinase VicK